MTEREALIALNQVSGLGAITVKRMIEAFGSAVAIFHADERNLRRVPGIGSERGQAFRRELDLVRADGEIARAAELGVQLLTWADAAYPAALQAIADPPLVLYVAGAVEPLSGPCLAVIGTRRPTQYGREMAQQLAFQLAGAGYVIVSGLALGIDTQAHRGALQAGGRTVGVLGGALDCLYPKENEALSREMASQGGAVMCEYPFGRQPDRQTFPMRNRIVSGLVKGVVVIEAPLNSGTLITVDQALDQGRSVMAFPGRADSPASAGCHRLLRSGARLVTSADEVLEELQELLPASAGRMAARSVLPERAPQPPASAEERLLLERLENEPLHVDDLIRATGLPAGTVNSLVVGLQIKRRLKLLPGGMVKRA
ncbi:MAG: DNA-processing protein DprA [Kiritimatiellia bacterium]